MFSSLGPLFKTQFRQAESNDTRQSIPHQERDNHRRNNAEDEQTASPEEAWTDDTTVSIFALRSFLIDFLKTIPGGEDSSLIAQVQEKTTPPTRPKEKIRPTNTHNAKAVRAYQTMASHSVEDKTQATPEDIDKKRPEPSADQLESQELRDIHNLILDLEFLEKKGLAHLNILKASSFVEGMKQAVLLAKSKI